MSEELLGLEKELAEVLEAEKKELGVEIEVEPEEPPVEEPKEEIAAEEPKAEEPKKEDKPDASVYYKLREEARKREALEQELAALKAPKNEVPSADDDIEGHFKAKIESLEGTLNNVLGVVGQDLLAKKEEKELETAFSALKTYEDRLASVKPDYESARNHIAKIYAEEYKLKNPNLSGNDLIKAVAKEIISVADYAAANGKDPAEFIYERASLYGYRQEAKQEPVAKREPDLSKIAANKQRSAGMAAGVGAGAVNEGAFEALEKMSNEERMALSETQFNKFFKQ